MTGFIVERGAKGLAIPRVDSTFGSPAWTICEVALDDCFVADADVLGPVGAGFGLALEALDEGRLNVASICLGAADALNEESAAYAATRRTFGAPMSERQAIQWMLADSATDIAAARSLIYAALTAAEAGKPIGATASMAKLFSSEMAFRVADRAVQIHGGNGLAAESRIGSVFRDLRIFRVGEGASEIQRMVIARDVLRNAAPR
jgi:acyl-CoA dehydrogenase